MFEPGTMPLFALRGGLADDREPGEDPDASPDALPSTPLNARLDVLLGQTVDLLSHSIGVLRSYAGTSRTATDAARLTAAVAQIVRAHHQHAGPATPDESSATAALVAALAELDAELT